MLHPTLRTSSSIIVAALLGAAIAGCSKPAPPEMPPPPPLTEQGLAPSSWKSSRPDLHDRLLVARALAQGKSEAIIMVATEMGNVPVVANAIFKLGGEIHARADEIGYLRVRMPLERLPELSALPYVLMAHPEGDGGGGAGGSYARDRDPVRYSSSPDTPGPAQSSLAAEIDTLLSKAIDPGFQVITQANNAARFPEGGQDLFALIANRVVEVYGKVILAPGGEGTRVESIEGPASARRVLAIGAYETPESFRARYGLAVAGDLIPEWSSRGPASDGGAKPDLLMPASADAKDQTSVVQVAERAIVQLLSSARAGALPADARHLTWALRMSARRLDNHQAHEQGFGVLDIAAAKELLKQVQARRFDLPDIQTRAPVKTYLGRFLPEAGIGQGIYERLGWLAGQRDSRTITLIRHNGPVTPLAYTLEWRGNDGTFKTSRPEVELPLHTPVDITVDIEPASDGIHSAHLYLVDKASGLPVHAVMTTIVASEQFTAANGYNIRHTEAELPLPAAKRYFLEVPPNISSLRIDVSVGAGQVEMKIGSGGPAEAGLDFTSAGKLVTPRQPAVLLVPNPPAGVYELTLLPFAPTQSFEAESFKRAGLRDAADIKVSASIYFVDSELDQQPPKDNRTTFWMNNVYAPLLRSSVLAEVGVRRVLEDVGGPSGMRAYNIVVPAGSSSLRVAAGPPDERARMGVYLYDCVGAACKLWGADVFTRPTEKRLVVPNPRPGLWRVVVDASAPGTAFKYTEIITNPAYGSGAAAGEDEARRIGARWNQAVSFQSQGPVPFGYERVGVMDLVDVETEAAERAAPFSDWQSTGDVRNQPLRPVRLTTQVMKMSTAVP